MQHWLGQTICLPGRWTHVSQMVPRQNAPYSQSGRRLVRLQRRLWCVASDVFTADLPERKGAV
eukprot:15450197-Alexandrium_andersonii.AAC.1